jgi:hypothetical protein
MDKITIERETLRSTLDVLTEMPPSPGKALVVSALRAALAAQPADAQPTGQSPCARHCEAPAFEGEIRRLKRELQTQAERIRVLREALVIIKANAGEAEQVYTVARAALEATQ